MNPHVRNELVEREKHLEDIRDSLADMRRFALSTKDWPRKTQCERSLKRVNERLLGIHLKLAAMGA